MLKITYFVTTTKETSVKRLVRLFRDNIWNFHGLSESVILDRRLQFVIELTKKLNRMLNIEIKLLTLYSQIDSQTEQIN